MNKAKKKAELKLKQLAFREFIKTHCGKCQREFGGHIKATGKPTLVESPNGRSINAMRCGYCWTIERTCARCKDEFSISNPGTSWPWPKWGSRGRLCLRCK